MPSQWGDDGDVAAFSLSALGCRCHSRAPPIRAPSMLNVVPLLESSMGMVVVHQVFDFSPCRLHLPAPILASPDWNPTKYVLPSVRPIAEPVLPIDAD